MDSSEKGKRGGRNRAKALSTRRRQEIARQGGLVSAAARGRKKQARHNKSKGYRGPNQ